uniref:Uncharacterized protein n=1 Tax=Octopus bimaculoides TaxID=37653 RepID=A0A0L8GBH6_OCTBM
MQLSTKSDTVHLLSAYAPTQAAENVNKDIFYKNLQSMLKQKNDVFILINFNARVGLHLQKWLTCLGHFGIRKINENGRSLLVFCSNGKDCDKVSYCHLRFGHWYQIWSLHHRQKSSNQCETNKVIPQQGL